MCTVTGTPPRTCAAARPRPRTAQTATGKTACWARKARVCSQRGLVCIVRAALRTGSCASCTELACGTLHFGFEGPIRAGIPCQARRALCPRRRTAPPVCEGSCGTRGASAGARRGVQSATPTGSARGPARIGNELKVCVFVCIPHPSLKVDGVAAASQDLDQALPRIRHCVFPCTRVVRLGHIPRRHVNCAHRTVSVGAVGERFLARVPAVIFACDHAARFASIVNVKCDGLYRRGNPTGLTGGNAVVHNRFRVGVQRREIGRGSTECARCTRGSVGAPPVTHRADRAVHARIVGI